MGCTMQLAVLDELVSRYGCDGVEYDFACAPGGGAAGARLFLGVDVKVILTHPCIFVV